MLSCGNAMPRSRRETRSFESATERSVQRKTTIDECAREIEQLREYARLLKSQRSGASSERVHRDQLGLFNEAEQLFDETGDEVDEETVSVSAHTRAKRGRRPLPS